MTLITPKQARKITLQRPHLKINNQFYREKKVMNETAALRNSQPRANKFLLIPIESFKPFYPKSTQQYNNYSNSYYEENYKWGVNSLFQRKKD